MLAKKIIDHEFFIIDSDNLDDIENRLYGFALQNSQVVQDNDITEYSNFEDIGVFVLIEKKDDEIIISQDVIGSYGVYVYQKDGYFAVSNSFIKLVEYLKFNHEMTLNRDYAYISLLPKTLSSLIYEKTLVNEIICISRNTKVHIDITSRELSFEEIKLNESSIDIDSEEGLKTLDKWFFKWVEIIRGLKQKTNNISLDLSGGFDTRMIMPLVLTANIDMNSIRVHSIDNDQHNHDEDFRIASLIADEYGFKLNTDLDVNYYNYPDVQSVIDISCYVKLGFNNQLNFKLIRPQDPIYMITGMGGGISRGWPKGNAFSHITNIVNRSRRFEPSFVESTERIITESLEEVKRRNPDIKEDTFQWSYYKETRLRNHFGKLTVENYMSNNLALSPLIDPDLFKLKINTAECKDNSLLMTLIFVRYWPQLMEFEVEGGREFNSETIEYAKKINEIYPYTPKEYSYLSKVESEKSTPVMKNNKKISWHDINKYLKDVFKSKLFKYELKKYTPEKVYDLIFQSIESKSYFQVQDAISAFALVKVINTINFNENNNHELVSDWFDSFLDDTYQVTSQNHLNVNPEFPLLVSKFMTGRIDIKNNNSPDNAVEVIENSDKSSKLDFPLWLKDDEGAGCLIESTAGYLDVKVKCIGDGELSIKLRGVNASDKNNKRYPVYIDYTKLSINGEDIIKENTLVWHDEPFSYEMPVADGEILTIHLEWMPINKNSDIEHHNLVAENKSLKKELEKVKKMNEEMLNSTSWKVTGPLRKIKKR